MGKSKKQKKNKKVEKSEKSENSDEKKDSSPMEIEPVEKNKRVPMTKNLKQSLIAENAYITGLLSIINFPKREDSDDDDVIMNKGKKNLMNKKGGAQSVQ